MLLEGVDALTSDEGDRLRQRLGDEPIAELVLLGSKAVFNWPGVTIPVPELGFERQRALWKEGLGEDAGVTSTEVEALTGKFRPGDGAYSRSREGRSRAGDLARSAQPFDRDRTTCTPPPARSRRRS